MGKRFVLSALLGLFFSFSFAGSFYIQLDPSCMTRMEYESVTQAGKKQVVAYQLRTPNEEKIMLELADDLRKQEYVPTQMLNCTNTLFTINMVRGINNKTDKVFMVIPNGSLYSVLQVQQAAYLKDTRDMVTYESPDYAFTLNKNAAIIGENIASDRTRDEVYFEGRLENKCGGAYIFRRTSAYKTPAHVDFILLPEVGVAEERKGLNFADAINNTTRLMSISGVTIDRYLENACAAKGGVNPATGAANQALAIPTDYGQAGERLVVPSSNPGTTATPPVVTTEKGATMGAVAPPAVHVVQAKEGLFSIAKKYGTSVEKIQAWNKKGKSTAIKVGEKLFVSDPAMGVAASAGVAASVQNPTPETQAMGAGVVGSNPTPNPNDMTSKGTYAFDPNRLPDAWIANSNGLHTVQHGETVAFLSAIYGFTEERLRFMNNLQPAQEPALGTIMKVSDCGTPSSLPTDRTTGQRGGVPSDAYLPVPYDNVGSSGLPPSTPYPYEYSTFTDFQPNGSFGEPVQSDFTQKGVDPYSGAIGNSTGNGGSIYSQGNQRVSDNLYNRSAMAPKANTAYEPIPTQYEAAGGRINTGAANTQQQTYQPQPGVERSYHLVKEGDSLYQISRKYGITVDRLRFINNFDVNEVLMPYQKVYLN